MCALLGSHLETLIKRPESVLYNIFDRHDGLLKRVVAGFIWQFLGNHVVMQFLHSNYMGVS